MDELKLIGGSLKARIAESRSRDYHDSLERS